MSKIYINGKFLGQRLTGVQRFASEIVNALDQLMGDEEFEFLRDQLVLVMPATVKPDATAYKYLRTVRTGHAASHWWEQFYLVWVTRGHTLLSLSGSAPLFKFAQIVTFHDAAVFDTPESYSRPFRWWYSFAFIIEARIAQAVITISEFSRQRLASRLRLAPAAFCVVPNGCDHILRVEADNNVLQKLSITAGSYLLAVGSSNPSKNFAGLFEAYGLMPPSKRCKLVVVGGTNNSVFAAHGEMDSADIIRAGAVTDQELKALYSNAKAFIFPSLYEGFGIPPLEAMACHTAVAASNAASIPEVCGDAALFFDPTNSTAIANALADIVGDAELRSRLRQKAMSVLAISHGELPPASSLSSCSPRARCNEAPHEGLAAVEVLSPITGGIESVVFELTEGLNRRGVVTDVMCANNSNATVSESYGGAYQVTRVASLGKLLSTSMAPTMLPQLARATKSYDIVHVHLPDPMTNLALWWARPQSRIVVHWHSDIVAQQRALKLYEPLQRWLLAKADAIIATSPPYAESSPWLRPFKKKVDIIPIGIDATRSPDPTNVHALRSRYQGKKIVFSLGRMTYYKGFDVLVDAAEHLAENTIVLIGGAGELSEKLNAHIQAKALGHKVKLVGRISDAELPDYFALADVFCLPSIARSEAFGVVLLEAMAAGLPIVATDIPGSGVPWVAPSGVTGLNVTPGDSRALAEALEGILSDGTKSHRFASNGRHRFDELFTADKMVDSTLDLYRRIAPR